MVQVVAHRYVEIAALLAIVRLSSTTRCHTTVIGIYVRPDTKVWYMVWYGWWYLPYHPIRYSHTHIYMYHLLCMCQSDFTSGNSPKPVRRQESQLKQQGHGSAVRAVIKRGGRLPKPQEVAWRCSDPSQ